MRPLVALAHPLRPWPAAPAVASLRPTRLALRPSVPVWRCHLWRLPSCPLPQCPALQGSDAVAPRWPLPVVQWGYTD